MLNQTHKHTPDVLDCIANLSNDEVFTSPKLANEMLDMLPQELFTSTETRFLDPFCKSGVFLREIVKRLDKGLENKIIDKQKRIDHIMHNQVFGIAITELTALLSRRTLYCSKYACSLDNAIWIDKKEEFIRETHSYSVSEFTKDDVNEFCLNPVFGNIKFVKATHQFDSKGVCKFCGANKSTYNESNNAYELIHINENKMEVFRNMEFDVIIGNPPYHLKDGNEDVGSASPIYNIFVEQAKKLRPRYLSMIIPSRWMVQGKGLNGFRDIMINDKHITVLHDFINSTDCFTGVSIPGGVCYFLRERDYEGMCRITTHNAEQTKTSYRYLKEEGVDVFIRQPELVDIKDFVWIDKTQKSFAEIVSSRKPYGLHADFFEPKIKDKNNNKIVVSAQEKYGIQDASKIPYEDGYSILGLYKSKRACRYIPKDYPFARIGNIDKYKLFMSKGNGSIGTIGSKDKSPIISAPVIAFPGECCTETFLEVGGWDTLSKAKAASKYVQTKFFRSLVAIMKQTQNMPAIIYKYVPMQDFTESSDIDWSESIDEINQKLYEKYNLSEDSIRFIEENIAPMNSMLSFSNSENISEDI